MGKKSSPSSRRARGYGRGTKKTQNRPLSFCAGCYAKKSRALCRCADMPNAALRLIHAEVGA